MPTKSQLYIRNILFTGFQYEDLHPDDFEKRFFSRWLYSIVEVIASLRDRGLQKFCIGFNDLNHLWLTLGLSALQYGLVADLCRSKTLYITYLAASNNEDGEDTMVWLNLNQETQEPTGSYAFELSSLTVYSPFRVVGKTSERVSYNDRGYHTALEMKAFCAPCSHCRCVDIFMSFSCVYAYRQFATTYRDVTER